MKSKIRDFYMTIKTKINLVKQSKNERKLLRKVNIAS